MRGKMKAVTAAAFVLAAAASCGGDDNREETRFLANTPSEETLCSFVFDVTTREQVESVLGEPTAFSDTSLGSSLQYWIGPDLQAFTAANGRALLFDFDARGVLQSAFTMSVSFPQCWRDRLDELEN